MNLTFAGEWLIVFICAKLAGIAWAKYTASAAEGKPLAAANWDAAIVAIGCISMALYFENRWLMTASIAGTWLGTFIGVKKK